MTRHEETISVANGNSSFSWINFLGNRRFSWNKRVDSHLAACMVQMQVWVAWGPEKGWEKGGRGVCWCMCGYV